MKRCLAACLFWVIANPSALGHTASGYNEETVSASVLYKDPRAGLWEKRVPLRGVLWVPHEGKSPHPLAIYSHGSQGAAGEGTYPVEAAQFSAFLDRGYAVFFPLRKGFNRKGTPLPHVSAAQTEPLACNGAEEGLQSAIMDSKALFAALKSGRRSDVDFSNVTLFGHSRGGMLSIALAAEGLPGVRKVVNFSGGWQTDCPGFNTAKFSAFAQRIKVPILSFYGAYDSAWKVSHIKENLAALENRGMGKGHVLTGAGHNVFETHADTWVPIVFGK